MVIIDCQLPNQKMQHQKVFKQRLISIAGICLVFAIVGCQQNVVVRSSIDKRALITAMYQKYAAEFPQVQSITVEDLQQLQERGEKIVLVDVRSPKERLVSTIPGAIATAEFEANLEHYRNSDAIIIAYCTIGYRSGRYAQKLKQQGIKIFNLEGSLLAWTHVRGELVNSNGSTHKIHVFNRQWQLTADSYQPVW